MAGREKNCRWHFSDQPNGQETGPNNAMEENFKHHPYASLVRESIQNSLDAVADHTQPVLVKYSFKRMNGLDFPFFFELKDHIKGCIDYFNKNTNAKTIYEPMLKWFEKEYYAPETLGYIRISDYNTKGMDYVEGDTSKPFYAFVRSAGVSAKENTSAGGSFGFGKAAYYLLSPISSIIVSTCTEDYKRFFEGVSSLCTHFYHGEPKMAVGFYDSRGGKPIADAEEIPVPFRRDEPGTDINILGFDFQNKEEAIAEMAEAVLRNFWMAILNERLVVEIDNIKINRENIASLMEEYFPENEDATRKAGHSNPRPYFDAVYLNGTSIRYTCFEKELPLLGNVVLYINRHKGATDKISYMRALQMLVYAKRSKTSYGLYGVFYCGSTKGNEILRELENSAHDEWKSTNWRVDGHVSKIGREALKELEEFVSEAIKEAFASKSQLAINIKGLEEFLYIPTSYDEDDDLESEALVGKPTGVLKEDGSSYTTDIPNTEDNPTIEPISRESSSGHVVINRNTTASPSPEGNMRSGHGDNKRKTKKGGIESPGDAKDVREEDASGDSGVFATPIYVPYRTFSQHEEGKVYHYVVLHSDEEVNNVRLHFYAVGEDREEELQIAETNEGVISGNVIQNIYLRESRTRLRVRFADNMKHAIKLSAEEIYEI